MLRLPKLTERVDEAHSPANNLALCMAFAGVGIINMLMAPGGLAYAIHLWY